MPGKAGAEVTRRTGWWTVIWTKPLRRGKEAVSPEGRKSVDEFVSHTQGPRKVSPWQPRVWTQSCISSSRAPCMQMWCKLTLATAAPGHAVPAVTVFAPEGPRGIDAVPFPAHIWPQALVNIYMKQKTSSSCISQNRISNPSHLPGWFEVKKKITYSYHHLFDWFDMFQKLSGSDLRGAQSIYHLGLHTHWTPFIQKWWRKDSIFIFSST